jgi:enamine deaminase RidA (YjgF/YER057c/UK114 family)
MNLVSEDARAQTGQIMKNILSILHVLNSSFAKALVWTVYIINLQEKEEIEEEIQRGINNSKQRTILNFAVVSALPKGAKVEILLTCLEQQMEDPVFEGNK